MSEHKHYAKNEVNEITDQRKFVLKRPGIYLGSMSPSGVVKFLFDSDSQKIEYKEKENITEGMIKAVCEVIDNSVDEAIRCNFELGNKISIKCEDNGYIEVRDNGRGIPTKLTKNKQIPMFVSAWTVVQSGSNYEDDANNNRKGTNGVGVSCTNIHSVDFIGTTITHDTRERGIVRCKDNMSDIDYTIDEAPTSLKHGTSVKFLLDFEKFGQTEFNNAHKDVLFTYLINQSISYPKIEFTFNGKLVQARDFKQYIKFYSEQSVILHSDESVDIAIYPARVPKHTYFVNGLDVYDGGNALDYIVNGVVDALHTRAKKGYGKITKDDVKSKLSFIVIFKNRTNLKWGGQTKSKCTNNWTEFCNFGLDWVSLAESLYKNKNIMEDILLAFQLRNKFEEQKALKDAFKPKKPTEVDGLLTATEENVFLHIVEGDSAKGLANAIGRKDKAFITSGGKLPNLLDAKPSDIAKNKKIKPIIEAMGYDFGKKPEDQQLNYEYIVSTVDRDSDGNHIQALLLTFIYKFLPHLIDEGRVLQFITPLFLLRDKNDKVVDFAWSFQDKKDKNLENKPGRLEYVKGLGALSEEIMNDVINLIGGDINDLYIELDREGVEEILTWMGKSETNMTTKKRILSEDVSFSIDNI